MIFEDSDIKLKPALYVTATPIGNYKDITIRAIETLKNADIIACEDTRVTAKLLAKLELKKSLLVYNDHSSESARLNIIKKIKDGNSIILVSDAGTPLISDPGYKLVKECMENDVKVVAIPGVSSTITALSICGLPTDKFIFCGFFQPKSNARIKQLEEFKNLKATLVFFETARRLLDTLNDIRNTLGERQISVARELTKLYEEVKTDTVSNVINYYTENPLKGEIVLIIEGWSKDASLKSSNASLKSQEIEDFIKGNMNKTKPKKLAKELTALYEMNPKEAYNLITRIRSKG